MLAAAAVLAAGCNDSSKNTIRVRPNAPVPVRPSEQAENLPLRANLNFSTYNLLDRRSRLEILMAKMRARFEEGQKAFDAGKLDAARGNFDQAVSLVLASGIAVDSDPQLAALFDQILDAVHSDALENAESAENVTPDDTMSEPAPIDEIADLTTLPPGDPRLAQKAETELMKVPHDLPLTVNDSVLQYLSFFQTPHGRLIVETGLRRAGRYHDMIRRVLRQEGLPQDLIYLAQAESAFQPTAVSRAGARGIWQFMPYRGEEYDLSRSWWIDERSDPEKATHAAAHHLRDLYAMFADFWELQKRNVLPEQTKNYVPIILALALVAKDPPLYGVQVDPDKPPDVDLVKPGHPIDLRLAADATGTDLDDLRMLNPELLRLVTPDLPGFELRLPVGTAAKFQAAIATIPADKWKSWRIHEVVEGETLASIAERYRISVGAIKDANHLSSAAGIELGDKLTIPAASPATLQLVHYRVQRGDTLAGIAEQFSVTIADIKRWNGIRGNQAPRGSRLRIYAGGEPARPHPKGKSAEVPEKGHVKSVAQQQHSEPDVQHRVKPGETLFSIARENGTTVAALRQANPVMKDRELEAGHILTVGAAR